MAAVYHPEQYSFRKWPQLQIGAFGVLTCLAVGVAYNYGIRAKGKGGDFQVAGMGIVVANLMLQYMIWELWWRWSPTHITPTKWFIGATVPGLLCGVLRAATLVTAPEAAASFLNPSGEGVDLSFRFFLSAYFLALYGSVYAPFIVFWNAASRSSTKIQSKLVFTLCILMGGLALLSQLLQIWRGIEVVGKVAGAFLVVMWIASFFLDKLRELQNPRCYVLLITLVLVALPNAVGQTMLDLLDNREPIVQLLLAYVFHISMGIGYFLWRNMLKIAVGPAAAIPFQFGYLWISELFGAFLFLSVDFLSAEMFAILAFQRLKDVAVFGRVGDRVLRAFQRVLRRYKSNRNLEQHVEQTRNELVDDLRQWHLGEIMMMADVCSTLCVLLLVLFEGVAIKLPNGNATLTEDMNPTAMYISYGVVFLTQLPVVVLVHCYWRRHLTNKHDYHQTARAAREEAGLELPTMTPVAGAVPRVSAITGLESEELVTLAAAAPWNFAEALAKFWLSQRAAVMAMMLLASSYTMFSVFMVHAMMDENADPL